MSENLERQLKEGEIVFSENRYSGIEARKVSRFTETLVVLDDGTKIRKPFKDGVSSIGVHGYRINRYYFYSEFLQERYERQLGLSFIKSVNFNLLKSKTIGEIIEKIKLDL